MTSGFETNDPLGDRVLVLEDDPVTARLVSRVLGKRGFRVRSVESQEALTDSLTSFHPQVVIVDNVPNFPCSQSCALVKARLAVHRTPVVVYSGLEDEQTMVELLSFGADRVIPKSFSPNYLAAEVAALLRVSISGGDLRREAVSIGGLRLDPRSSLCSLGGVAFEITPTEFKVLYLFAMLHDRVVTREEVIAFLHGDGFRTSDRLVDVFVVRLRRKLAGWAGEIVTIRGVGYQLLVPEQKKGGKEDLEKKS